MSGLALLGWGGLVSIVATAFVLGAAPVFAVRCLALLYPPGHERRRELVAEMAEVQRRKNFLRQWGWLGQMFATAVCEGLPSRAAHRRHRAPSRASERAWNGGLVVAVGGLAWDVPSRYANGSLSTPLFLAFAGLLVYLILNLRLAQRRYRKAREAGESWAQP